MLTSELLKKRSHLRLFSAAVGLADELEIQKMSIDRVSFLKLPVKIYAEGEI